MTTAPQAERLVRKIAEAMASPAADGATAKLAQDYAELCRAAARRLEQCALMIEAGQDLQALQLAETPPPLLDLVTVLAFRQAAEWRAYCQQHQLPWAEPFYDKHLRLLNSSYGKGVASDHPYYRDYRRAVLQHKDARALSILRVIMRMNPADENTKEELRRVEGKILKGKMEQLRDALASPNGKGVAAQMALIESAGVRVPPNNPIWQQAQVLRCQELLAQASAFREKDAWQETEKLVDQIHSIATQYDLKLPAADADAWSALEEWSAEKHRAFAEDQDFQHAVSALEYEIQTVESRRNNGQRLGLATARKQMDSLSQRWVEAQRSGRPLPESLPGRYQQANEWLKRLIHSALLGRRIALGALIVVIAGAVIASIPSIRDWQQTREFKSRFASLEAQRKVADVEKLVEQIPPRLEGRLQTEISDARDMVAREKDRAQTFGQSLGALQQMAAAGFREGMDQIPERRAEAVQLLGQIAPEFQPAGQAGLAQWDRQWITFRDRTLQGQLLQAEALVPSLNGSNGAAVADSARRIRSILAAMAPLRVEPPALDAGLEARYAKSAELANQWLGYWDHWQEGLGGLAAAESVEDYLDRLDRLMQSPFAGNAQRAAAAEIDRVKINSEALLGELLLPNQRAAWDSLTNASSWRLALMPQQPTPVEKDLYFKLRDDKNLQNVYAYLLVTNARANNPYHTHLIYARGAITMDRGGQMAGSVYDPEIYQDAVRFNPVIYSDWDYERIVQTNRTRECDSFERLGLAELIDPNTGFYQKPILQLLDQLNRDDNSSAVFRAFVSLRLLDLMALRPDAWGMNWGPDIARHFQALKDLGANDLKSGDWMAPVPLAKYEAPLAAYFLRARGIPLEKEAGLLQRLTQAVSQTDFSYAGYVNPQGQAVLRRAGPEQQEFWGWASAPQTAALLFRKTNGATGLRRLNPPLPWTPLFIFNGDRRALLDATARDLSFPTSQMKRILPPFFSGLYE